MMCALRNVLILLKYTNHFITASLASVTFTAFYFFKLYVYKIKKYVHE